MLGNPAVAAAAASSMLNPYAAGMIPGGQDLHHMAGGFDLSAGYNPQLMGYGAVPPTTSSSGQQ